MNWYNLPTYYDVSFSHEMREELLFLKAVFKKYCKAARPKLLEPACGTGRLIMPMVRAGFDCTGFDLNENALNYLKEKLARNQLKANIFEKDMVDFQIRGKRFDIAYCTVDTFRHLLKEKEAVQHLEHVAEALKPGGVYILGLHLISKQEVTDRVIRWTAKRGRLTVKTTMQMLALNKSNRTETLKVILETASQRNKLNPNGQGDKFESVYKLRTYTLKQFQKLVTSTNMFETLDVYDHYYDIKKPIRLTDRTDYGVFVLGKI